MAYNGRQDTCFIRYGGLLYFVNAVLFSSDSDESMSFSAPLDMQCIAMLQYENALNDFLVKGKIVYLDQFGMIDKFLQQQDVRCMFTFAQMSKESDSGIDNISMAIVKKNAKLFIEHEFIVDRIRPVKRDADTIQYEIDLVSSLWKNCTANIVYSTYKDEPQTVTSILAKCMQLAQLKYDEDQFVSAQTDAKIEFITKANDNVMTVFNHLIDKLYFFKDKDLSIKTFFYDIVNQKYRMLDLGNINDIDEVATHVVLSFLKGDAEGFMQQKPVDIGSYINATLHTTAVNAMLDRTMHRYDFERNAIDKPVVTELDQTRRYMNNTSLVDDAVVQKYTDIKESLAQSSRNIEEDSASDLKHFRECSYWHAFRSQSKDIFDAIRYDNAIVLELDASLARQPGTAIVVAVDRSLGLLNSDSAKDLKSFMEKYKVFEHTWIVSKVITTIKPNEQTITQKAALFRNFAVKTTRED